VGGTGVTALHAPVHWLGMPPPLGLELIELVEGLPPLAPPQAETIRIKAAERNDKFMMPSKQSDNATGDSRLSEGKSADHHFPVQARAGTHLRTDITFGILIGNFAGSKFLLAVFDVGYSDFQWGGKQE
jgi:hypothetical protein